MVELAPAGDGLYRLGFAGDTFNTAWYARRCLPEAWHVEYATMVGTDSVSDEMVAAMEREGIGTGALARTPDRTVGLYLIQLKEGERSFSYWRGQSAARLLADDPEWLAGVLRDADLAHFSGITLAILPPHGRERLCEALRAARARGTRIVFDTNVRPALWESTAALCDGLRAGAAIADVILPSFDEEQAAFGDATPAATIDRYRAAGAEVVVVKNGAEAIEAAAGDERITLTPEPVAEVVDTTAAGDSFAAAFLAAEAAGDGLEEAVRQAMRLSGRVIGHRGALARDLFS